MAAAIEAAAERLERSCFLCGATDAKRGIYDHGSSPVAFVCDACDAAHAENEVRHALEYIEQAQREMGSACQQLSPIEGGGSVAHKRLFGLYDRIRAEWYKLRDRDRSRWRCDNSYWLGFLKRRRDEGAEA